MKATVLKYEEIADGIYTFWLSAEQKVDYIAGQFIEINLPHENTDDRGQKRWFTLSSSPTEKYLSFTTKRAASKTSTFKQALFSMSPGDTIDITEPMGDFVLPKDTSLSLVFVASGIGITTFRSMIKWLHDTHQKRSIRLIYGMRELSSNAFSEELETYGIKPEIILSKPGANWAGKTGQLNGKDILNLSFENDSQLIYVSGPEQVTEKLEMELLKLGVSQSKLVLDFFPGYKTS